MDQPHRAGQSDLGVSTTIISPLTPRSSRCVIARGDAAAIDHEAVEIAASASLSNSIVPPAARWLHATRQHARGSTWPRRDRTAPRGSGRPARLEVAQRLASRRRLLVHLAKRSKSARSRACATTSEPLNGVSGNAARHSASERMPSRDDHRLGGFRLAPRRQHAAGPVAGGLRHCSVTALMQRDGVTGLREQQRLPGARNACAYDRNGGIPPETSSGTSLSLRRHDPDQVQRVTAVPDFSPELRYLSSSSELPSERL